MATDVPPPPGPPPAPPGGGATGAPVPGPAATPSTAPRGGGASPRHRGRGPLIAGLVVLAIVLVAAGIGAGYLVFHKAATPVATASPRPSATATTVPATASSTPATPSPSAAQVGATTADLTAVAGLLFPQAEGGGLHTSYQGDTSFAQCPVTDRLRTALKAAIAAQTGGGGDPICGCQNLDSSATFTYSPDAANGGIIHELSFGTDRVDFVAVSQHGQFLVDDILYCSATPPSSIYKDEGAPMC